MLAVTACTAGPSAAAPDVDGPTTAAPDADGPDADGPDADGPDADGPDAAVPDVVESTWRQPGSLDIRFTVRKHRGSGLRTVLVHSVLTVGDAGRVQAMHTVQSGDGVVRSHTDWTGGPVKATMALPGCAMSTDPVIPPGGVAGWLAEPFGPVDATTTAGWAIGGTVATRPGSTADTVEQAALTVLGERTIREIERRTRVVVTEVGAITVRHTPGPAPGLPACGARWTD
jgi:hypothetical protein